MRAFLAVLCISYGMNECYMNQDSKALQFCACVGQEVTFVMLSVHLVCASGRFGQLCLACCVTMLRRSLVSNTLARLLTRIEGYTQNVSTMEHTHMMLMHAVCAAACACARACACWVCVVCVCAFVCVPIA